MGTINYCKSDYVTIGYDCNNIDYEDEYYNDIVQDCFDVIAGNLRNEFFYYFHITLEPGYYEGFSINIEFNFKYCFDNSEDKKQAQKEITRIKRFLIECVKIYDLRSVSPGWVASYATITRSIIDINNAIKEMRETVKQTPTRETLPTSEKYA